MQVAEYRQAIAAALSGLVGLVALFVPGVQDALGPEVILALATVLATLAVHISRRLAPPAGAPGSPPDPMAAVQDPVLPAPPDAGGSGFRAPGIGAPE